MCLFLGVLNLFILKYLLVLFCFVSLSSFSQDFSIKGRIVDDQVHPLEAATIFINSPKDSTVISYTISDKKGEFELEGKTNFNEFDLIISFVGYKMYKKHLNRTKGVLNLGTIPLEVQAQELVGVDVVAYKTPVAIKKDTLEFNAASFKTQPDASVEDLLKKLPGVEVDTEGNITVNGKPVNEILVNGKPFFGDDPKIATKNLTKEIVSKIQISDTKTESEKFTGEKGDSENKSINIKLKEGKNKGFFARTTAGYGTDKRYDVSGIINYFKGSTRLSLLSGSNNINSAGFTYDEVFDAMKEMARSVSINGNSFGSGEGINTSSNIGANYVDEIANKHSISANYFYSSLSNDNHTKVQRETFLPNSHFFTHKNSSSKSDGDRHSVSSRFQFKIDSTFRIYLRPSFEYSMQEVYREGTEVSFDDTNKKINESVSNNSSRNIAKKLSNSLAMVKKMGSKGSFIRFSFSNNNSKSEANQSIYNTRNTYKQNLTQKIRNQISKVNESEDNARIRLEYRQPLFENLFLDIEYRFSFTKEIDVKNTYDIDPSGNYTDFNKSLSSDFYSREFQHQPSLQLNYNSDKIDFDVRGGMIYTDMFNEDKLQKIHFEKEFSDVAFSSSLRYKMNKSTNFSISYYTQSRAPSAKQLQPIDNINNPLHTYIGNPNLNRQFVHSVYTSLNSYDYALQSGVFLSASMRWTQDKITPITTTSSDLLRTTTYTNLDGDFSSDLYVNYSKTFKRDRSQLGYKLKTEIGYDKYYQFSDAQLFYSKSLSLSPGLGLNYSIDEVMTNEFDYFLRYNYTTYSLSSLESQSYAYHNLEFKNTFYLPANLFLGSDLIYVYNPRVADGFNKSATFWNLSLGMKLFKEQANLKLKAYDVLNQNNNTRRIVRDDYIQDTQNTVLRRYFMLSFTYKWNTVKGTKIITKNKKTAFDSYKKNYKK